MKTLLQLSDIETAYSRIGQYVNKTPIFSSSLLNKWLGHEIYFKAEGMQKIGAFKARGAYNTISWLVENDQKPEQIVANSSGNHAQAVAWASKMFDIPSTIYMPSFCSKVKIQATRSYDAEVVLCDTRMIADEKVKMASLEAGTYWVPPYNHDQVILGQGTAAYEALKEVGEVDSVFAPCGGGGLLSGTYIATKGLYPNTEVIGAEPLNANDAVQSIKHNAIQRLTQSPETLADGAMTLAVGDLTFEYLKKLDDLIEIEETELIYWTQWLTHLLKLRIEPTSAMAMAAAMKWLKNTTPNKKILIILSGANIDQPTNLKIWKNDYLHQQPNAKYNL